MLTKKDQRSNRQKRIKGKLKQSNLPRLTVFRSNQALYVSIIDKGGKVLVSAKAQSKNQKSANDLGEKIAKLSQEKKIINVVFDRSGYLYHGKIKALADAARQGGLKF